MTRRGRVVVVGVLGALFLGGVSQAFLWRWGLSGVAALTDSQFMWVLFIFGIAWGWAEGYVRKGVLAGAATGLALIASYYGMQWLTDGQHSVIAQFTKAGGPAWTLAAVGGGALVGLFGGLASMSGRERPRQKALGVAPAAVIVGGGPALWVSTNTSYLEASRLMAAAVFLLVGVALLVYAVRTCGARASIQALVVSSGIGATALAGLLWLQTQGSLYVTF